MILTISTNNGVELERFRCDGCGKTRDYLSDSWSEIEIPRLDRADFMHHCLECRSDKKEYRP